MTASFRHRAQASATRVALRLPLVRKQGETASFPTLSLSLPLRATLSGDRPVSATTVVGQ